MNKILASLALVFLAACYPVRYVAVDASTVPAYTYCSWDNPCYYAGDEVYIYEWGWFTPTEYVYYVYHPYRRFIIRRDYGRFPIHRPMFTGRDRVEKAEHDHRH